MAKYLVKISYSPEGAKGLKQAGGSARRAVFEQMVKPFGGSVESFYFAFGGADAYVIADMPDNVTAAAISLTVAAGGAASQETVVLLDPEELDRAANMEISYSPPGK